ncbi:MAG: DEAD/DEAH box helicase [Candidatus Pristimantibacillus sp.]
MKAYVYLVFILRSWHVQVTIAPDVDRDFWLDEELRKALVVLGEHVLGLGGRRDAYVRESKNDRFEKRRRDGMGAVKQRLAGHRVDGWLLWKEALPLGDALRARELWKEDEKHRNGKVQRVENNYELEESKALSLLEKCVEQARREGVGLEGRRVGWRPFGFGRVRARGQIGDSLHARAERWSRAAVGDGERSVIERANSSAKAWALAAAAKQAAGALQGRALLRGEAQALLGGAAASMGGALQLAQLLGWLRLQGAVAADAGRRRKRQCRCLRCGSGEAHMHRTPCVACGRICAYCSACLAMGRSRECELLLLGMPSPMGGASAPLNPAASLDRWKLSPAQAAAAQSALHFIEAPPTQNSASRQFLLWAVTGAGKTEMIFPLVESVLRRGGKALIATPRRDVVLELDPRIRKAFPDSKVVTLYGGSEDRWERGDITLSTTHQLMRFHQMFNLVIVDELDAFPFHGDPILHYAADKCGAPNAAKLLLSATPPIELQRQVRSGELPHARVPVRYHRHPLPVPKLISTPTVGKLLLSKRIPPALLSAMKHSLDRGAQLFIFVQRISQVEAMARLLQQSLKHSAIEGTSSQDSDRGDKVARFRSGEIRVLVTTTILERGVTIPRSDVYILDADGRLFDEASLVQMAGRAGRSSDDPNGLVYFCGKERTRPQIAAVRQIQTMNRIARVNGYLVP